MKINRISPDLYEIENFITDDQLQQVLAFARNLPEEAWFDEELEGMMWQGKQYQGAKPHVFDIIDENVKNLFATLYDNFSVSLQRYKEGHSITPHRDYWIYELPYHIRYGICIYYNDDYEGGELHYPELNITHKPKPGSLVMHGGNILHTSLPVKGDVIRYFSTTFIRGTKENPITLNQELFKGVEEHDGSEYIR